MSTHDWQPELTRRRFLAGLAVLGATPLVGSASQVLGAQASRAFTGDDLELGHRLLMNPGAVIARGTPADVPGLYDTIIVGGGIAGLVAAYRLRQSRLLLLEGAADTGGVAKSAHWMGIEYALGAAYIIDPDPDSEDPREKTGFELLAELGLRARGEDIGTNRALQRRLSGDANHCVFSSRRVVPEEAVYSPRNRRFFEHVLDSDNYPSVPATDRALVDALDRVSFEAFLGDAPLQRRLYGRSVGPLSALGREAIEYYCWGAFGTTARETSAYHGLNFFAAEYGDILVFPGGNACIARRLAERIRQADASAIRTGAWTLRVDRAGADYAVTTWESGTLRRYRARTVVLSAPLFLAPRIVPALPDAQKRAIATLDYRAYVVANVLLGRSAPAIFRSPAFRQGYELTRVHGVDIAGADTVRLSGQKVYSDAILADFATGGHPSRTVLTVYRPYPYRAGRAQLMAATYQAIEDEVRREVLAGFGPHGLRALDIEGVEIARWGHPMIVTRPGQLADGTLAAAAQSMPGLYFAHTDVTGSPAYENAIAAAHDAVDAVRAHLAPA
jgi:hypothetical protein